MGQQIKREARERPTGQTLHALGLWYLVDTSDPENIELAVATLREAVAELPASAKALNDLAVAYYVRASAQARPEDLIRSLSYCDRAVRAAPRFSAALFTRAMVLGALQLKGEATRAWQRFLLAGDSSEWTNEARSRLVDNLLPKSARTPRLSDQMIAKRPSLSAADIVDGVRADPVDAMRGIELNLLGNPSLPSASERFRFSRWVAGALIQYSGDRLAAVEVEVWERAVSSGGERLCLLSAGYIKFQQATSLYNHLSTSEALEKFEQASDDLRSGGSPLYLWADYWTAVCLYWKGDLSGAEARLAKVQRLSSNDYPLLWGYIGLMRGLVAASQGNFDFALEEYGNAQTNFERSGAIEELGFVRVLLAQVLEKINDYHSAWKNLLSAFLTSATWHNQRWREGLFAEAADVVRSMNEPEIALYFQDLALKAALLSGQPATISEEYSFRSIALTHLGRGIPAATAAREARRWLDKINDPTIRQQSEDSVLVAEARIAVRDRPGAAADSLAAAIRDRRSRGATALLAELELEQGRLQQSLGRIEDAEKSLLAAVSDIEIGSAGLKADKRRNSYFVTAREAFDEIIRFEMDIRKNPRAALVFTDRAQVNEFISIRANREGLPTLEGLDSLQSRLGQQDGVIVYRALGNRLLIWLIRQSGTVCFERSLSSPGLTALVDDLTRSLSSLGSAEAALRQASIVRWRTRLYDEVVAPVAASLADVHRLWVVPDGPLFQLPFGALVDPGTGRYLCERYLLAKSLTAGLGEPRQGSWSKSEAPRSVLAIGDPEFSPDKFLHLPRLPHARKEASMAADVYPDARVLLGAEATRDGFLAELSRREVVHFAGHALVNRTDPEQSMLVLAEGKGGRSGALYAKEIENLALKRTRLIVLSSCGVPGDEGMENGGFYSLVRPFLAAGVRVVIGSLWKVDDASTARLFAQFHRTLRSGDGDPLAALQHSQEADLGFEKFAAHAFYAWAPFEAYVERPEPR